MSFARVEDNRTILFEGNLKRKYRECHVFIDVFPIDGVPENEFIEKGFMLKQLLGIIMNASAFCFSLVNISQIQRKIIYPSRIA